MILVVGLTPLFPQNKVLGQEARPIPTPLANGQVVYVVEENDTLDSISAEFGISVAKLRDLNRLPQDAEVIVGMRLLLVRATDSSEEEQTQATATTESEPSAEAATLTPTLSPTEEPTGTPEPTVTPTETPELTVTPTVTPTETATPEPIATLNPLLPTPVSDGRLFHLVESGDTLLLISNKYKIKTADLLALNGLDDSSTLYLGQKILLGYGATATPLATATPKLSPLPELSADGRYLHIIQPNDTIYGIAIRYGLKPQDLLMLNKLDDNSVLKRDDQLLLGYPETLRPNAQNIAVPSQFVSARLRDDGAFLHVVQPGETVERVAERYGYETLDQFLEVSGLDKDSILKAGGDIVVGYKTAKPEEIVATATNTPTVTPTATSTRRPTVTPRATATPLPTETVVSTPVATVTVMAPGEEPNEAPETNYLAFLGLFASLLVLGGITLFLWLDRHNQPKHG